jgi:hypothetical protein
VTGGRLLFSLAVMAVGLVPPMPARTASLSLAAGPTVAEIAGQLPPVPAGMARVWFLRQYEPSETLQTPMIFVDDRPLTNSVPGTAFYRDFSPGSHTFSVETCTRDFNQATTLSLMPGTVAELEVQSLQSMQSFGCLVARTFYIRPVAPRWAQLYATQLVYLGPR